jgi:small-conductance mechanosensitive channel
MTTFSLKAVEYSAKRLEIPALILQPLRTVVKRLIFIIVLTLIAGQFGIQLMTIVTAALAAVAIGFLAVWSMMSNITATLFLVIMKPFNVHDKVELTGEEVSGEVIDVNLFYTTLKDDAGRHLKIPNNQFFQKVIRVDAAAASKAVSLDQQLGHPQAGGM